MRLVFSMHLYLVGKYFDSQEHLQGCHQELCSYHLEYYLLLLSHNKQAALKQVQPSRLKQTFIIVAKGGDQILEKQKNNHNKGALLFMNICDKILSFINIAQQKQTGTQLFFNEFSQRLYQL